MTAYQMTALCHAICDALESQDADRAATLAYLGTRMCEAPAPNCGRALSTTPNP